MEFKQAMQLFCKIKIATITVLFLFSLSSTAVVANACPLHERNYLLHFKSAVADGDHNLQSWQGFNCCTWAGIGCDFRTGHVTLLDLRSYYLEGNISSSLFELAELEHLDLSGTYLQGNLSNIPMLKRLTFLALSGNDEMNPLFVSLANLSNLTNLEYLSLDRVDISSMKAEEWGEAVGRLSGLRELSMSWCGLRGPIPYSLLNLTSLLHLHLSHNSLSAQIPTWFANLTSHLLSLDLSKNDLFGSVSSNLLRSAHRLQQLDLSGNQNLGGDLSFIEQQSFPSLTSVDLSDISLQCEIPSAIGNMSRLELIDLSYANIEGLIPPSIGNLSKLVLLDLAGNKLSGVIPPSFSELVRLNILYLHSNSLNDSISLSLFHGLSKLQEVCLSNNHLMVSVNSTWIPQFENLRFLGLASCDLAGIPSFLVTQYYLEHVDLSGNSITGNIPSWIWNLPNLRYLILGSNRFTGSLPSTLTPQTLQVVDLHNNSLEGALPLPAPNMFIVDLSMNEFNGSIPSDIGAYFMELSFLSLSGNYLSGSIPESLCISSLFTLDLSRNMISNQIPPNFIGNDSALTVLNLAENRLQGEIPKEWGTLKYLRTLNLNGNQLRGAIPPSIAKCYSLQVLDLGNNNLAGTIPHWMGNLSQLQILRLRSNNFHGTIPPEIIGLRNLQILDLSHNKLSGSIPGNLTHLFAMVNATQRNSKYIEEYTSAWLSTIELTISMKGRDLEYEANKMIVSGKGLDVHFSYISIENLKCIDLSNNNLSGGIPLDMGSLKGLIALNLSRNHLIGQIPKTLGGINQLESLDLSVNKLNGTIPLELQSLNYLEFLNLSFNMLEGKVPLGGQFLTFEESSYFGNADLSGIPFTNKTCNSSLCREQGDGRNKSDEAEDDPDSEMEWWAVGLGLSYGLGFSIVIGVLTFNNKVRKEAFNLYDRIIFWLFNRG